MAKIRKYNEITSESVCLPRRKPDTHKGDYGRVLIIGGSVGYTGAPVLSARAASKAGAGLVYAGVPESIYRIAAVKLTEEMPFPLADTDGVISIVAAKDILNHIERCDACLIGPGLGMTRETAVLVRRLISKSEIPLILDADALNIAAEDTGILKNAGCPLILTPHAGEFARLCGKRPPLRGSRPRRISAGVNAASQFAKLHNCILVLKGNKTIIASPDGGCYVNTTGGPALSKGGTGDVLAGIIASLVAQKTAGSLNMTLTETVKTAVYLHGLSGDLCAQELGEYSVTAGDVIETLPKAMITIINN